LRSGARPRHGWRAPLYRSHRAAAAAGIRAALWVALASIFFVLAGWPSADVALSLVAVVIGLGATTPNPQVFTKVALIAAPITGVLAGILEFLILDGVTDFPLLALALAPFIIGAAVAKTWPHPIVSALGRFSLIFILVILSPSNPQSYDPNSFLFTVLFLCAGIGSLLAAQLLVPPASGESRQSWLLASVRRELDHVLSRRDRRWAPHEAMFRDAARIGHLAAAKTASPRHGAVLREAHASFDQAATIRMCHAGLARGAGGPGSDVVTAARRALSARDPQRIHDMAHEFAGTAPARDALVVAGIVIEAAARHAVEPTVEQAA